VGYEVEPTGNLNHKPLTINQEPVKREKKSVPLFPPKSDFSDEFIAKAWPYYLKCKQGKPYKNIESQEVALRQLYTWCGGDETIAKEAFAYTVSNGYQGFNWYFKHKSQGKFNGTNASDNGLTKADHFAASEKFLADIIILEQAETGIKVCNGNPRYPADEGKMLL
jgi:hypothetical protein